VLGEDTANCVRLAACWGRARQRLQFGAPCLDRTALSCTGMMNPRLVDLLGAELGGEADKKEKTSSHGYFFGAADEEILSIDHEEILSIDHEYVSLSFSAKVLDAMKAHGIKSCRSVKDENNDNITPSYISKNDMIMAATWLLKRFLSKDHTSHLSVVLNLRGRCGVKNFDDDDDEKDADDNTKVGLFGNGIVNVFAEFNKPSSMESSCIGLSHVCRSSTAILMALIEGVKEIPRRLVQSKIGRPSSSSTKPSSSNTSSSWRQLSPRDISFSPSSTLVSCHGQPAHPISICR
jgi:hypothetical protein